METVGTVGKGIIPWPVFAQGIIPFATAFLFLVVLVYFTLVRERMKREYPYYAAFLLCFTFYLAGPLLNVLPLEGISIYYHYARTVIQFTVGFPMLLLALYIQAGVRVPKTVWAGTILIGLVWSLAYVFATDLRMHYSPLLRSMGFEGHESDWIQFKQLYYVQGSVLFLQIVLPCIVLLSIIGQDKRSAYIYGALSLGLVSMIGCMTDRWPLYAGGSAICAFAWAWAMLRDVRDTNSRLQLYHTQQQKLASAQFITANTTKASDAAELYPASIDERYPYREREELIDVIRTSSRGLVGPKTERFLSELEKFAGDNIGVLKTRVRETVFLLADAVLYEGADANVLLPKLQVIGQKVGSCKDLQALRLLIDEHCEFLIQQLNNQLSESTPSTDVAERIKVYILAHYSREDLDINDIADALGFSRSYATKNFKLAAGMTISQYIGDVRVSKAKDFLLEKSVTETAFEVGFRNSNYFSTVFRKQCGITPKQFQLQAKGQIDGV